MILPRSLLLHVQLPSAASALKLPEVERHRPALLSALTQVDPSWRQDLQNSFSHHLICMRVCHSTLQIDAATVETV